MEHNLDHEVFRATALLTELRSAGAVTAEQFQQLLNMVARSAEAEDLGALRDVSSDMARMATELGKHVRGSKLADLVQYFLQTGEGAIPVSIGTFRVFGSMGFDPKTMASELREKAMALTLDVRSTRFRGVVRDPFRLINEALALAPNVSPSLIGVPPLVKMTLEVTTEDGTIATVGPIDTPDMRVKERFAPPTYVPHYSVQGMDVMLHNFLQDTVHGKSDPETLALLRLVTNQLAVVNNNNYFGNGSPAGQVGRNNAVYKEHQKIVSNRRKNLGVPFYKALLRKYMKFKSVAADLPMYEKGWPLDIGQLILRGMQYQTPVHGLTSTSDPGLIWPETLKRGDVFAFDIVLANQLLTDLSGGVSLEEFWKKWDWVRLSKMKPKAEVYERDEFEVKTRNIYVMHSFAMLPQQIILKQPMSVLMNYSDSPDNLILLGFKIAHGHFDKFYRMLLARKKPWMGVFSDNLYRFDPIGEDGLAGWRSFDGSKHEASVTGDAVLALNQHVMEQYWSSLTQPYEGVEEFSKTLLENRAVYGVYASYAPVAATMTTASLAQLGSQQLVVPGQVSGAVGTGYNNTTTMIGVADALKEVLDAPVARSVTAEMLSERRTEYLNVPLSEDGSCSAALAKLSLKVGVSLKYEAFCALEDMDVQPGDVQVLDLLGNDVARIKFEFRGKVWADLYVPVLNYERLLKSMNFTKRGNAEKASDQEARIDLALVGGKKVDLLAPTQGGEANPLTAVILEMIKFQMLYLIGAWAYPTTAVALVDYLRILWRRALILAPDPISLSATVETFKTHANFEAPELYDVLFKNLVLAGPPTIWDVMCLYSSDEQNRTRMTWLKANWMELEEDWLRENIPWRVLVDLGAGQNLVDRFMPASQQVKIALLILDRPMVSIPPAEKMKIKWGAAVDKPTELEAVSTGKRRPVKVGPVEDPHQPFHVNQSVEKAWLTSQADEGATQLLKELMTEIAPVVFFVRLLPSTKNEQAYSRSVFTNMLMTLLNAKGGRHKYDKVRKALEDFYNGFEGDKRRRSISIVTKKEDLPKHAIEVVKGKKGALASMRQARINQVELGHPETYLIWPGTSPV
jgi:hypothetical protein